MALVFDLRWLLMKLGPPGGGRVIRIAIYSGAEGATLSLIARVRILNSFFLSRLNNSPYNCRLEFVISLLRNEPALKRNGPEPEPDE